MPNRPQLLFLISFFISLTSLFALSNFLSSKLREAGYDFSRLILFAIPPNPNKMTVPTLAPSFLDVRQSVVAQLFALLFAAASSAFIYLKFGRSGTSSSSFHIAIISSLTPSP
jgi:cytochrome-b5 reductase